MEKQYNNFEAGCAQLTELSTIIVKAVENVGGELVEVLKRKLFVQADANRTFLSHLFSLQW